MDVNKKITRINISPLSYRLCCKLLDENPRLAAIIEGSQTPAEANSRLLADIYDWFSNGHDYALQVAKRSLKQKTDTGRLKWEEIAAIRIHDYLVNAGKEYENLNKRIQLSVNDPFTIVWLARHKRKGGGRPDFFRDMIHLFRQFSGQEPRIIPTPEKIRDRKSVV